MKLSKLVPLLVIGLLAWGMLGTSINTPTAYAGKHGTPTPTPTPTPSPTPTPASTNGRPFPTSCVPIGDHNGVTTSIYGTGTLLPYGSTGSYAPASSALLGALQNDLLNCNRNNYAYCVYPGEQFGPEIAWIYKDCTDGTACDPNIVAQSDWTSSIEPPCGTPPPLFTMVWLGEDIDIIGSTCGSTGGSGIVDNVFEIEGLDTSKTVSSVKLVSHNTSGVVIATYNYTCSGSEIPIEWVYEGDGVAMIWVDSTSMSENIFDVTVTYSDGTQVVSTASLS